MRTQLSSKRNHLIFSFCILPPTVLYAISILTVFQCYAISSHSFHVFAYINYLCCFIFVCFLVSIFLVIYRVQKNDRQVFLANFLNMSSDHVHQFNSSSCFTIICFVLSINSLFVSNLFFLFWPRTKQYIGALYPVNKVPSHLKQNLI